MAFTEQELLKTYPTLRRFAISLTRNIPDGEDLAQETMTKMLAASESFQTGTNLEAWGMVIVRNTFYSSVGKKHTIDAWQDEARAMLYPHEFRDSQAVQPANQEQIVILRQALDQLSTMNGKGQMILASAQGFSLEELSEKFRCKVGTVKSRLFRAHKRIEATMEGREPEPETRSPPKPKRVAPPPKRPGNRVTILCQHCQAPKELPASIAKRQRFCSIKCNNDYNTARLVLNRSCQHCQTPFHAPPSLIKVGGGKFCSKSCASKSRNRKNK